MVKFARLGALATLCGGLANAEQPWLSGGLLKGVLTRFGVNSSFIDSALSTEFVRPAALHVVDITDENWETVLRTGAEDPFGKSLEDDTTWVITVYGPDGVSNVMLAATDAVAEFNSSQAGGTLPANMRFGRIDYAAQTVLPTLWWLWRIPAIVIATNTSNDLRFFKIKHIIPNHLGTAELLANRTLWETMPIWEGSLAPGGKFAPYMPAVARGWAKFHQQLSRIPTFVVLMISGALMNFMISFFHQGPAKPADTPTEEEKRAGTAAVAGAVDNVEKRDVSSGAVGLEEKKRN